MNALSIRDMENALPAAAKDAEHSIKCREKLVTSKVFQHIEQQNKIVGCRGRFRQEGINTLKPRFKYPTAMSHRDLLRGCVNPFNVIKAGTSEAV